MTALVSSIDIARPQGEVFAYVTDPTTFAEWQAGVVGGSMEGGTTPRVGSKCMTKRRIGRAVREVTSEITRIDPPTSWGVHGLDGPIRAIVDVTVEPLDGGGQSRVTIAIDFEGHGIGKLLVPLVVRRQASNEMRANCARLKQSLEETSSTRSSGQTDRAPLGTEIEPNIQSHWKTSQIAEIRLGPSVRLKPASVQGCGAES